MHGAAIRMDNLASPPIALSSAPLAGYNERKRERKRKSERARQRKRAREKEREKERERATES